MFLGHYGVALAAKRAAPRTSLGILTFAGQFLDELWPLLLLAGVERVRVVPGLMAASSFDFVSYPVSHSLLTAAGWALLIGLAYLAIRHRGRSAIVIGLLVLSHWFLDLVVHRADLPLWPGSPLRVGLGLWNSLAATIAVELILFTVGILVYARSTRAIDRVGSWGLWTMLLLLAAIFCVGLVAAPPADQRAIALGTLGIWLFVPWSWWVDRHRESAVPVKT